MSILYTIGIHCGKNLPKADRFGKIDAYCVINVDGTKLAKTNYISSDYNPVWKEYYCFHSDNPTPNIQIVLYDKDKLGKDDLCGDFTIPHAMIPCAKMPINVENIPSSMIHSKEISQVVVSVGKCISYAAAKVRFSALPGVICDDSKFRLAIPINPTIPVYFCIEYENTKHTKGKADLELSLINTSKEYTGYVDFSWIGKKYKIKKRTNADGSKVDNYCGKDVFSRVSLPDMKIHNLIFCNDLVLRWGTSTVKEKLNIHTLVEQHGWVGLLSYARAKATLKDFTYNDKHEHIYFKTAHGTCVVDYDKDKVEFFYLITPENVAKGLIPDATCAKENKRTITFDPRTFQLDNKVFAMKANIDDIPFGTLFSSMDMYTLEVAITGMTPIFALFPLTAF